MGDENKIDYIYQLIENIETQFAELKNLLGELGPMDELGAVREKAGQLEGVRKSGKETIIEGVFDGQNMVGPDGKSYTVPANYASKSKLVEGDIMKLTIQPDGSFVYKQIGPVQRKRISGRLVRNDAGSYRAITPDGKSFRLLTASVTYYKGEPGDTVVLLVPEDMGSKWAAVENILQGFQEPDLEEYWEDDDGDDIMDSDD